MRGSSFYGPGFGPITLGSLQCTGSETRLADCLSGDISTCTHAHDAGVMCRTSMSRVCFHKVIFSLISQLFSSVGICSNGDVRLVAGSNPREGRVEVCYNERYGTICDNGFDSYDARVICGQLGYSRISKYLH